MLHKLKQKIAQARQPMAKQPIVKQKENQWAQQYHKLQHVLTQRLYLTPSSEIDKNDIVIVGYPKSGNTWFRHLVSGIAFNIDFDLAPIKLTDLLVPEIDLPYYLRFSDLMYYKSHSLPQKRFRRVVYLLRDGRDVMVSYFRYLSALGSETDFLKMVTKPNLYPSSWQEHVEQWMLNPYQADMLIIRYEDLLDQPLIEMKRFCDFANLERDTDFLSQKIEAASFERMKKRESTESIVSIFPREHHFVRRGVQGSYKDEMPPEILEVFLAKARETLLKVGYSVN